MKRNPRTVENGTERRDTPKIWNILVYLAADNSLVDESVFILTEILKSRKNNIDVTAQFEGARRINRYEFDDLHELPPYGTPENQTLQRVEVRLSDAEAPAPIASAEKRLGNFLLSRLKTSPDATYNMVVLSGHGDGAVGSFLSPEDSPISLTIPGLREVLTQTLKEKASVHGKPSKIDLLGLDSCLMSMAEVGYEVRDCARYLISSEGFGLRLGWPYRELFEHIDSHPTAAPETIARDIVRKYTEYYGAYTIADVSVDQAACDLGQMDKLANAVRELARLLSRKLNARSTGGDLEDALILAHWRAQSYNFELYTDLWDFCELLRKSSGDSEVRAACRKVRQVIKEKVVLRSCFSGAAFQHSHGISIYFPWTREDLERDGASYEKLQFDQDTKWSEFLDQYLRKTRRKPRKLAPRPTGEAAPVLDRMSIDFDLSMATMMRIRENKLEGTRENKLEGTRNGAFLLPRIKNAPTDYLKFPDGCCPDSTENDEEA